MDVTWQGKLHEQQQHSLQHGGLASGGNPAAAAARGLGGMSGGAFDPSALQWGLGAGGLGLPMGPEAAAAAASQMLSALGPAQVLALLGNPLYLGRCLQMDGAAGCFAQQHYRDCAHVRGRVLGVLVLCIALVHTAAIP